ncbi:SMI1/KNR4 family protein [Calidithermus terrae]|uniref:SMI1/KNR4 family protein n=1 Tax=Calidithermus terrae TaxID=1408545 RepID=UPI0011C3B3E4|nr:SMI1/KNR4 family protein [Calidithermus terrae]
MVFAMPIRELVELIRNTPDCEVAAPAARGPALPEGLLLPPDLEEFYSLCDGLVLFKSAEYTYRILPVEKFEPMDRAFYGECWCGDEVISGSWFFVAENWNADKIAIDLHPRRLGRCYDCFVGESYPVIACSFEELLKALYENRGEYTYWLKPGFKAGAPCDF